MILASVIAIAVIESTGAGKWIAETGLIHLVSVSFIMVAGLAIVGLRRLAMDDFKPFLKRVIIVFVILGFFHVIEYFIDVRGFLVDEWFAPLVVSSFYTVAIAVLISATTPLLRKIGTCWYHQALVVAAVGIVVPVTIFVAALLVVTEPSVRTLAPFYIASFVALSATALSVIGDFLCFGRKFTVFSPFTRKINTMVVLIVLAGTVELTGPFLMGKLPISELVFENVSHYFFYASLAIMSLTVDLPRHFGGVYVDIRTTSAEERAGASSSKPV